MVCLQLNTPVPKENDIEEQIRVLEKFIDACLRVCDGKMNRGSSGDGDEFYKTKEWRILRYATLKKYGKRCSLCECTDGPFHVDHIKPRSKFPELELDKSNLQVLCEACNVGKSNLDDTDWRSNKDASD